MALISFLLIGCQSIGPGRIPPDHYHYNESLGKTANEQMVLNLVRLRHMEVPVFLTIGSVVTGYSLNRSIGVSLGAAFSPGFDFTTGDASPSFSFAENPTITYTPLAGRDFTERMLKPLPLAGIFALGQSGWPIDLLLIMGLQSINEHENLSFVSGPTVEEPDDLDEVHAHLKGYARFREVIALMLELLQAGALEFEHNVDGGESSTTLHINPDPAPKLRPLVAEFRNVLDLDPTINSFQITTLRTQRKPDQIVIKLRSLVAIMSYLSLGVQVSQADVEKGVVIGQDTAQDEDAGPESLPVPLLIRTGPEPPDSAFVAIQYRDDWYYIDETDIRSKRTLAILNTLFSVQGADSGDGKAPVLTLPASR